MPIHEHHKDWILLLILLTLLGIALYISLPYLSAIFTGAILAYLLKPLYQWLSRTTKSERIGGILLSIIAVLAVFSILAILITTVTSQATSAYQLTKEYLAHPDQEVIQYLEFVNTTQFKTQALGWLEQAPKNIFPYTSKVISNILNLFLFIAITIFATAYFLLNGTSWRKNLIASLPLRNNHTTQIAKRFDETVDAVIKGNIGTALLQGAVAGIIFTLLGVPGSIILAFILTIAAFIPAVGPVIVWLPVAGFMLLKGNTTNAIILIALCTIVLGYIDNFLKPKLIGDKIKLNSFIIFIAVMGGISAFGILGIFAGPLIFALLATCIDIYRKHIH